MDTRNVVVLCTGNPGKVAELQELLPARIKVVALAEVGVDADLPETGETLEANAVEKAMHVHRITGLPCLADDTGLEVEALGGAPGVWSARYAGPARDPAANMALLLERLAGATDRSARFRTVLAYVDASGTHRFDGEVKGTIAHVPKGSGGFGYDPVFLPEMSDLTFAELPVAKKNAISHRGRAMWRFVQWLHERDAQR